MSEAGGKPNWLPLVGAGVGAVVVSFILLWVVKGNLEEKIAETNKQLADTNQALKTAVAEHEKTKKEHAEQIDKLTQENKTLTAEKDQLKKDLGTTVEALGKAQKSLAEVSTNLSTFIDSQKGTDANQNKEIAEVSQRVHYVEEKIKKLDALEADVTHLKNNAVMKAEFAVLKGDMEKVRTKAEITDQDLTDLNERTRLFQLRVLSARAREAAEAARLGDVKSLLARLTDGQ